MKKRYQIWQVNLDGSQLHIHTKQTRIGAWWYIKKALKGFANVSPSYEIKKIYSV